MKLTYIDNKKTELQKAINKGNIHDAVSLAKDLGLSQRKLCDLACTDPCNFHNFLKGKRQQYNHVHVSNVFTVLEKYFY